MSLFRILLLCLAILVVGGCNAREAASTSPTLGADGTAFKPLQDDDQERLQLYLAKQGYVCVPMERVGGGFRIIRARLGDRRLSLMVDTGAPVTYLSPRRTEDLQLQWRTEDYAATTAGAQAWCEIPSLEIESIRTGAVVVRSDDLFDFNFYQAMSGESPIDGLLGADVLAPHGAILDYASCKMYLRPKESESRFPAENPHSKPATQAGSAESGRGVSLAEINNATKKYDGRAVVVAGEVRSLQQLSAGRGFLYTTFELESQGHSVPVFSAGHLHLPTGTKVIIHGRFGTDGISVRNQIITISRQVTKIATADPVPD